MGSGGGGPHREERLGPSGGQHRAVRGDTLTHTLGVCTTTPGKGGEILAVLLSPTSGVSYPDASTGFSENLSWRLGPDHSSVGAVFSPTQSCMGAGSLPLALPLVPPQEARLSELQASLLPWSWAENTSGQGTCTHFLQPLGTNFLPDTVSHSPTLNLVPASWLHYCLPASLSGHLLPVCSHP